MTTLAGRVVVVTGASSGIGRETSRAARQAGAHVVAVSRHGVPAPGPPVPHSPGWLALSLDVREPDDMAAMAAATLDRFGRIDVLVACAGVLRTGPPTTLARLTVEEWDTVVDTNLRGVFLSNRAVLPAMLHQHHGTIVNLSSTSGRRGLAYDAAYCASKFGVLGLTESLAEEVGPDGIRVHALLPGPVDTAVWEQNAPLPPPDAVIPPERIATVVLHLLTLPGDTTVDTLAVVPTRWTRERRAGPGRRLQEAGR